MKATYISRAKFGKFTAAIAAAALLAGNAAPGVLAADYTAQLTKTIDMTAAPGAGVPPGRGLALRAGLCGAPPRPRPNVSPAPTSRQAAACGGVGAAPGRPRR